MSPPPEADVVVWDAQVRQQVAREITAWEADRAEFQMAADGGDDDAVGILPPWLLKQAGFPGDVVACVDGFFDADSKYEAQLHLILALKSREAIRKQVRDAIRS